MTMTPTPITATTTATTARPPIALITGGSRGLGREAALALAARGTHLILTWRDREDEALAVVAAARALGVQALALRLDVGDAAGFPAFAAQVREALAAHWQREQFDALVHNAGHGEHASVADTTEAQFDGLMAVHVKGPFFLTQALLPLIADGGRILNVSSGLARFFSPGRAAYAMAKGAIEVFTRYLAQELGPRGIRVNVIAPGAIATDFSGGVVRDNPAVNAHVAGMTALGRVGEPGDIGPAIAALLSPDLGWVNGQRVEVSGGMCL